MNGEQILTEAFITCSVKAYAEDMGEKIREESEKILDINNPSTDKDIKKFMKLYDKERRKHKRRSKKIIFYQFNSSSVSAYAGKKCRTKWATLFMFSKASTFLRVLCAALWNSWLPAFNSSRHLM